MKTKIKIKIFLVLFFLFLAINVKSFAAPYQEGIYAYGQGNYIKAESLFRKALRENSNNNRVKYYLATTLVHNGKYYQAKRYYEQILKTEKGNSLARKSAIALNNMGIKTAIPNISKNTNKSNNNINKTVIDIKSNNNSMIIENVLLNNKINCNLVFDTGATYTVISKKMANALKINLNNLKIIKIQTANGIVSTPIIKLNNISINGLTVYDVEVTVHNVSTSNKIDGLLGMSFLKNFKVTVDRPNGHITLQR